MKYSREIDRKVQILELTGTILFAVLMLWQLLSGDKDELKIKNGR